MRPRWCRLLPGLWAGMLLCIATIAAPAAFAMLPTADAGRVVGRIFVQEAWLSLVLATVLLLIERRWPGLPAATPGQPTGRYSVFGNTPLLWATMLCTLFGYFMVQRLLPAARAGQGLFSFGQLHLASTVCYGLKTLLVLMLAWRALNPQKDERITHLHGSEVGAVNRPPSS